MPKYMFMANYTHGGLQGLLKEGGSLRREAVKHAVEGLGGTLDAFYYAFGDADVVGFGELPSNVDAAAFSMLITAAGGATVRTTVLLTPEEVDQVVKKTTAYRPPGK